jgi:hypothetical protein
VSIPAPHGRASAHGHQMPVAPHRRPSAHREQMPVPPSHGRAARYRHDLPVVSHGPDLSSGHRHDRGSVVREEGWLWYEHDGPPRRLGAGGGEKAGAEGTRVRGAEGGSGAAR